MRRLVALALLGLASAVPVLAQDSLEAAKRQELEAIRREAREKREAAAQLKGQENKALAQLRRTERELKLTHRRLQALDARGIERSMLSLQQQKERLARRLRNLYKFGGARELEFLLSPRSFAQLLARWDFLVMIAEQDRILLQDVQTRKEAVETNKQRLEINLSETERNARRTTRENDRLATLRQVRASTVTTIKSQREAYEAAAAELENTARALQRLLTQLERRRQQESARDRAQGREPQPYTGDFARGQGQLDWPVRGGLVGRFGPERHPKWGTVTVNNGIDIETEIGTPVRSVARGRVDYTSEDFGAYGEMIIVNHGDGYYTLYGHLSEIGVSVGQEVTAGQVIGSAGDTGSLKGPALHFEVRKGGTSLDPEQWLR